MSKHAWLVASANQHIFLIIWEGRTLDHCHIHIHAITGWWFGTWLLFSILYGMSSSQLTNSIIFQDGYCTTNQIKCAQTCCLLHLQIPDSHPIIWSLEQHLSHTPLKYPPSNFSYEMGRTWATVQIASQHFFVQTGGVVPPILYLESFCSWFLSNHAFSFCSCICWVSWSIQHKISLAFCSCTSWMLKHPT